MGVDAQMLVKVPNCTLTEADAVRIGYELAATIGPDHFMITRGDDHKLAFGAPHHAVSLVKPHSSAEYGDYPEFDGRVIWTQDGEPIVAEPGEQFLNVHLMGRYYGPGYERGTWPILRAIIEWLRRRFPGGEVWYGGDSSGICAELMTDERLRRLDDHFYAHGRRPYVRYRPSGSDALTGHRAPVCGCADVATVNTGGGRGSSFWWCDGCGAVYITSNSAPHGIRLNRNEDVFAGNRRLEAEGLL